MRNAELVKSVTLSTDSEPMPRSEREAAGSLSGVPWKERERV